MTFAVQLWQDYHTPTTVDEALKLLASYNGEARIIAGGTDLLIDLQFAEGKHPAQALVDVTRIPEMTRIVEQGGQCIVGAGVTHTAIVQSALIEAGATCLVESCGVVGGPQVRNVGTLGGNVAHALPAGDGTTSLVALDAEADVAWGDGRREWLPIAQLFKGAGVSALDSTRDVLVAFRFALCGDREGTAFKRIMRPQGVALPVLGCAVWVQLDSSTEFYNDARICIGPVASTPVRATAVEESIRGQPVHEDTVNRAANIARETLHPRTSKYRATAEYRDYMIDVLLRQALPLAVKRAQTGVAVAEGVGLG
jgi:carbon-monoxide dehydrogenase medium subunit